VDVQDPLLGMVARNLWRDVDKAARDFVMQFDHVHVVGFVVRVRSPVQERKEERSPRGSLERVPRQLADSESGIVGPQLPLPPPFTREEDKDKFESSDEQCDQVKVRIQEGVGKHHCAEQMRHH
jgi:hypothetical protein